MQRIAMIAPLALALAACQGDQKAQDGGNAQGEILPGSASDAMLPIDTVRSQAPLAPKAAASAKSEAEDTATEAAPEPAPEAAPKDAAPAE